MDKYFDHQLNCYNICSIAGSGKGYHTLASRQKMSKSHMGIINHAMNHTEETKKKISLSKKGTKPINAKLNSKQVLEIRSMLSAQIPQRKIAAQFNISQKTVFNISKGILYTTEIVLLQPATN